MSNLKSKLNKKDKCTMEKDFENINSSTNITEPSANQMSTKTNKVIKSDSTQPGLLTNQTTTTIAHRNNHTLNPSPIRVRPQSMLSARVLMFDEPSTSSDHSSLDISSMQNDSKQTISLINLNISDAKSTGHLSAVKHNCSSGEGSLSAGGFGSPSMSLHRKEILMGGSGLFKSASSVSVGRGDYGGSGSIQSRKTSYQTQHSHSLRGAGLSAGSGNEMSNLIRIRNSSLGKSAPSLSLSNSMVILIMFFVLLFI